MLFAKSGSISKGTVHLTAHHIIFRYDDAEEKEMWVSGLVVTASSLVKMNHVDAIPLDILGQSSSPDVARPIHT